MIINADIKASLRGVQAFQFWKHDFEIWIWGDGLGKYQQLEGGFGSMRVILPNWSFGAKNGSKTENFKIFDIA